MNVVKVRSCHNNKDGVINYLEALGKASKVLLQLGL